MKIVTKNGQSFELRKTTCRDHAFEATRAAVKKIFADKAGYEYLPIRQWRRKNLLDHYSTFTSVGAYFLSGVLRLGCHSFSRENSKKIRKWALS